MNGPMTKLLVPLLATAALAMATGTAQAQQKKTIALVTNVAAGNGPEVGRDIRDQRDRLFLLGLRRPRRHRERGGREQRH